MFSSLVGSVGLILHIVKVPNNHHVLAVISFFSTLSFLHIHSLHKGHLSTPVWTTEAVTLHSTSPLSQVHTMHTPTFDCLVA